MNTRLLIKFFIAGMSLFIVSVRLMSFRVLHSWETVYLEVAFPSRFDYRNIPERNDLPLNTMSIWAPGIGAEQYTELCRDLAIQLKNRGAKVVIIPLLVSS